MWNCSLSGLLTAICRLRANLSFFWMFGNLNQLDQFKTVSHTSWSWCRDLIKVWTLPLSSLTLFSGHQRSLALADLIRDNYSRTQGTENHRRWESPGSGGEKWGRCELSGDHMVWVISVWNQNPAAASSSRVKLTNNSLALAITLHTILEDRKKKKLDSKSNKIVSCTFLFSEVGPNKSDWSLMIPYPGCGPHSLCCVFADRIFLDLRSSVLWRDDWSPTTQRWCWAVCPYSWVQSPVVVLEYCNTTV